MFGKIIKADDFIFLEKEENRNEFIKFMVQSISELQLDFLEKNKFKNAPEDKPFDMVHINPIVNAPMIFNKNEINIFLDYNNLSMSIYSNHKVLSKMFKIIKEMDLIFQVRSNIPTGGLDDFNYSLCVFNKVEHRKMYLPEFEKENCFNAKRSKKEILVDSNLHNHIALYIYNMFGKIASDLEQYNNLNAVTIFYGDINFAFKDWVDN